MELTTVNQSDFLPIRSDHFVADTQAWLFVFFFFLPLLQRDSNGTKHLFLSELGAKILGANQ